MHFNDIRTKKDQTFSFEFFPAKTEKGQENLKKTINKLNQYNPDFVSVTYGAGGSTRDLTNKLVIELKQEKNFDPIPHLTCVCHTKDEIYSILNNYAKNDISNIMALRGDPPKDIKNFNHQDDEFSHAIDLVKFIKEFNDKKIHKDKRGFGIGVAGFPEGHPHTPNRIDEIKFLKEKVDAGADYIVTQLFFDNHSFWDFCEKCSFYGINVPIIAGIMPITSLSGMHRMGELSGGTNFPAKLLKSLDRCNENQESIKKVGIQYATEQCSDLLANGVDGIHFYTLNSSNSTTEIYTNLGLNNNL